MRLLGLVCLFVIGNVFAFADGLPPQASIRPVTDRYFDTAVIDNYRWLENGDAAEVKEWTQAQNVYARSVLDALPSREAIRVKMYAMESGKTISYFGIRWAGGVLFSMKYQPPKQQSILVALSNPEDLSTERVVLDPNLLDEKGGTSIDWFRPSADGKRIAVSISEGGSERGSLYVYDGVTGQAVDEVVPRVNYATAGGSMAWLADGSGFYYTRYPHPGERPEADLDFYTQVYFHRLGTPVASDSYEVGKDFPRIGEIELRTSSDDWVLANVAKGDGGQLEQFLRRPNGRWSRLTRFEDDVIEATFTSDHSLLLLSRAQALRGKLLKLGLRADHSPRLAAAKLFAAEDPIAAVQYKRGEETVVAAGSKVYVTDQVGGPQQVRIFDLAGKPLGKLDLPPVSALYRIAPVDHGGIIYGVARYDAPDMWYRLDGTPSAQPRRLPISTKTDVDLSDMQVIREFATSKDGTRIPFTILHRKGDQLDSSSPTILTGYGGYGASEEPSFNSNERILLDAGVTWVDANIRGGGEYGAAWHRAGSLTNKQNGFDDFIACAERLIQLGYTTPAHLAIEGSSEGGLLMGAALTQRPDLFKAVVSDVGLYDMLRAELQANGEFNTTEIGSVKIPDQFRALYAYSPYHHVKEGVHYPATLFLTGAVDARVDPMQSRKMTARLQAAESGDGLILLRTSLTDGHGLNTAFSEEIEQEADMLAFEFSQLGVSYPTK